MPIISESVLVTLVVALPAEAGPLKDFFQLKPLRATNNVFQSDQGIRLLVTGVGRKNLNHSFARFARTEFAKESQQVFPAWLNIGIAGHRELAVGEMMVANKISCAVSAQSSFPTPVLSGNHYGEVLTVDEPELTYPQKAAYDMEAHAFWDMALNHGMLDLIQCCKLISDNPHDGVEKITAALIDEIFFAVSYEIRQHVDLLRNLAYEQQQLMSDPAPYLEIADRIHLNVNQALQVRRLCQRFVTLNRESELEALLATGYHSARDLTQILRESLKSAVKVTEE